jgi:DNA-binding protein Fis
MDTVDKKEWEKSEILTRAILEVEDFFLHEKEGKLYDFLVDIIEKPLIENLLVRTEGSQLKAAKILGINRNTLHSKIKRLGIDVKYYKNERRRK